MGVCGGRLPVSNTTITGTREVLGAFWSVVALLPPLSAFFVVEWGERRASLLIAAPPTKTDRIR